MTIRLARRDRGRDELLEWWRGVEAPMGRDRGSGIDPAPPWVRVTRVALMAEMATKWGSSCSGLQVRAEGRRSGHYQKKSGFIWEEEMGGRTFKKKEMGGSWSFSGQDQGAIAL